jgi:preprotein translocase subunit SecG
MKSAIPEYGLVWGAFYDISTLIMGTLFFIVLIAIVLAFIDMKLEQRKTK